MNPLREHQIAAIQKALPVLRQSGGFYIAAGPGSGKSLMGITLARLLKIDHLLVVVGPLIGKNVWAGELEKWWPADMRSTEAAVRVHNADGVRKDWVPELVRYLKRGRSLLIADEGHYFASPQAQRTRTFWKLAGAADYVLVMSGSPAHNLLGFWSQYRVICPEQFPRTFGEYKRDVAILGGPNGNWLQGFRPGAAEEVARKIAPYTYHFDTKDLHLPEPIYTEVPVSLYPEERAAYAAMDREFFAQLSDDRATSASTALVKAMRLHQISCGHATDDGGRDAFGVHSAKLDALLELLKDRAHQKVVVACRFTEEIAEIKRQVQGRVIDSNYGVSVIDGSSTDRGRALALQNFQHDPRPHLLLIQYRSGGISADMTAADALILYSLEPSSIAYRQTIGRVWRMGQMGHVQILTLLAENTVDRRLLDGLKLNLDSTDLGKYLMEETVGSARRSV